MKKPYRIFVLTFAFMVLLRQVFDFEFPFSSKISEFEHIDIYTLLHWGVSLLFSMFFVIATGLADKIANKEAFLFLQIIVIICLLVMIVLYFTILIGNVDAIFVLIHLLNKAIVPYKIIILMNFIIIFIPKEKQAE